MAMCVCVWRAESVCGFGASIGERQYTQYMQYMLCGARIHPGGAPTTSRRRPLDVLCSTCSACSYK